MLHIHRTATNHVINRNVENSCQRIYFAICNACFWCTSCIDIEKMAAINTKCPCCDNPRLDLRSIMPSDDQKRSVEHFSKSTNLIWGTRKHLQHANIYNETPERATGIPQVSYRVNFCLDRTTDKT
jgi:hypothetical protein